MRAQRRGGIHLAVLTLRDEEEPRTACGDEKGHALTSWETYAIRSQAENGSRWDMIFLGHEDLVDFGREGVEERARPPGPRDGAPMPGTHRHGPPVELAAPAPTADFWIRRRRW